MKTHTKKQKLLTGCLLAFTMAASHGYEVYYGLPYMEKGAGSDRLSEWELTANALEGTNTNDTDIQRPTEERNTSADWREITRAMPIARRNAVSQFGRTEFTYEGRVIRTLPEQLVVKFRDEQTNRLGVTIRYMMPFDNQPNENRTLAVVEWSNAELQTMRDWLDDNGHSDTFILSNARNNSVRTRSFAENNIIDGISIEARASLWYSNAGRRQDFLRWATTSSSTRDKRFKFQVPFAGNGSENEVQAFRGFVRWVSSPAMLGSTDLVRRDDVSFMVITYGPGADHLPEKSADGNSYVNTLTSAALSIIEQRDLFEGRAPGGLLSEADALSLDRNLSNHEVGAPVDATLFDGESDPNDDNRIRNAGSNVGFIVDGSWLRFDDFDFGDDGFGGISVTAATPKNGSRIEVRVNSETGPLLGVLRVGNTGGFGRYQNFSNQISSRTGVRDLYLVFRGGGGGLLNLRSFELQTRSESRETVRIENTSRNILDYSGVWRTQNESRDSGGSMRYSNIAGNSVSYTFTGDRVKVGLRTGPAGGTCRIILDGNVVSNFTNTQASSTNHRQIIFDSGVLFGHRQHTVELVVLGSGGNVMFDFFETEE